MSSRPRWRRSAQRRAQSGLPKPHVGGEQAGENLAHEARPGHRADRDARDRVPEIIDAERGLEMRLGGLHYGRHRRDALGRRLEDIGAIVLVAEHHGVDAARLQALDVARSRLRSACRARRRRRKAARRAGPRCEPWRSRLFSRRQRSRTPWTVSSGARRLTEKAA